MRVAEHQRGVPAALVVIKDPQKCIFWALNPKSGQNHMDDMTLSLTGESGMIKGVRNKRF